MTTQLTPMGTSILESVRVMFGQLAELERSTPGDAEAITRAIINHVRSWKPMALLTVSPFTEGKP